MSPPSADPAHPAMIERRRVHTGRVLSLDIDSVRYPDGSTGQLEMIRHPGASAVVPFLTEPTAASPEVLLIRQYRYAADGYLFEVPAGRLEPGEDPRSCAARELREETGCTASSLVPLTSIYTTPGFTDELIHLFMATGLTRGAVSHERDEFIEVVTFPLADALQLIERGEIRDAKTVVALLFAAGYRTAG